MPHVVRLAILTLVSLCVTFAADEAAAQYFGRNKVEYSNFDFRVLATEHFDIYHYPVEAESATLAARLAERWHDRFSKALGDTLTGRQPIILYGSQPEFAQTNVVSGLLGEGIGGVTDSARRRITMPFAPSLAETDHILGHEIAHAFQFDMVGRRGGSLNWPLWAVEGMAQYLSLGAVDAGTATWLRDAVTHDLLPDSHSKAARRFSPYRFGHAFWAYLAGRYGDRLVTDVLKLERGGTIQKRLKKTTGSDLDTLYKAFLAAAHEHYGGALAPGSGRRTRLVRGPRSGRMQLGPAISPDGRTVVFFSEKDRVSLDLFQADADSGAITRKLATTAQSVRFESLQAIRSSGSWSHDGSRFVFAAIDRGRPSLVLIDMRDPERREEIRLPQLGQVFSPSWAPDGRSIAFSVLHGGVTDLYVYEIERRALRQLTDDVFADLQPAWSPDGRQIAFATERFAGSPDALDFGPSGLGLIDVTSGEVRRVPAFDGAQHLNPQWSRDGDSLYFIANPEGVSNIYRLDLASYEIARISSVPGGVTGLADTSPALSVAHNVDALAFTVYNAGRYEVQVYRGRQAMAGVPVLARWARDVRPLPPGGRVDAVVDGLLAPSQEKAAEVAMAVKPYEPNLSLEAIGQPYLSSGGGPFGTFVRGGGSLLFGDLLGERKLAAALQVGNRLRDFAMAVRFLNQERRLNWGALAELEPALRRVPSRHLTEFDGAQAMTLESEYLQRIQGRIAGVLAYPLNRAQRFELTAGVRHARFLTEVRSRTVSLETGRTVSETRQAGTAGEPATMGEVAAAFVGDTSIYGPTGPILGSRYRFEVAPAVGGLSFTRVHADYRRYLMPFRPYTIAARVMHTGHYGRDAHDPRLVPTFLGSRYFVRGYNWSALKCEWDAAGQCSALEELLGSRLVVGNLEVRVPLFGLASRDLTYGPLPLEAFVFADSGLVWSRGRDGTNPTTRRFVNSVGAGIRLNAGGLPFELGVVRALDEPARGWSFDFGFRTGF